MFKEIKPFFPFKKRSEQLIVRESYLCYELNDLIGSRSFLNEEVPHSHEASKIKKRHLDGLKTGSKECKGFCLQILEE